MEAIKVGNSQGLVLTVTDVFDNERHVIYGGMDKAPSWEEYLSDYIDEYKPHIELVKTAIEELGWVGETAENKANQWAFEFSDGTKFVFSWRAWGDLMSAIVGKNEGYMRYYM